jgi:hypothetical protein
MDSPGKITASGDGNRPILDRILNRVLRCSHRHQTRPITLKGETFAVCLDCGGRVAYSLDGLRAAMPVKEVVPEPAAAPKHRIRKTLRKWTREGVWLGLLAIGFAGGIFYSSSTRPEPANHTAPRPAPPQPKPEEPVIAGGPVWTVIPPPVPQSQAAQPVRSRQTPRLQSSGRVVVVAQDAAAALDVLQHPGKLGELIQGGSFFSVSRGTAIRVVEKQNNVVRVVITEGSRAGQEGWVPVSQVQ